MAAPLFPNVSLNELIKAWMRQIYINFSFQIDAITPVCANMDPVQAFLTQERLNAFMAHDDSQGEAPEYQAHLSHPTQVQGSPLLLSSI